MDDGHQPDPERARPAEAYSSQFTAPSHFLPPVKDGRCENASHLRTDPWSLPVPPWSPLSVDSPRENGGRQTHPRLRVAGAKSDDKEEATRVGDAGRKRKKRN